MFVEFPLGPLDGSNDRIREVQLDDGHILYVIGIEDIVLDRVAAYVNWNSSDDATQAILLLVAQKNSIDRSYLQQTAAEKGLADGLAYVLAQADALKHDT